MKSALVFWGGWDGHTPRQTAELLGGELTRRGFVVRVENSLEGLTDVEAIKKLDLIVPMWTMGQIAKEQSKALRQAIESGVGLAGVHGGMGDSFRGDLDYQWMVGGQFVGHPHIGPYTVRLTDVDHPVTRSMPRQFAYSSEQYYMLVDPAVTVLAETTYDFKGRHIVVPVVWTRLWGAGRVFYCALGHTADELKSYPDVLEMITRGMVWAAEGHRA